MKLSFFVALTVVLFINSCNDANNKNSDPLYQVNFERDISNVASTPLSYLGSKLEYVCLETKPDCMVHEISKITVADSFLFVCDSHRLLKFDRRGRYIALIGSQGRGPGDYNKIWDVEISEHDREIFILSSGRKMLVYNFDGKFIRNLALGFPSNQFVINESNELVFHQYNFGRNLNEQVYNLYIMNRYGKTITRIPYALKRVNGGIIIPISPLYMYDGSLHFMEFGVDTLYRYENHEKKPHAIFNYGKLKFPPDPTIDEVPKTDGKCYISNILETQKSIFVKICYLFPKYSISNCVFVKSTSEFFVLNNNSFFNDVDGGLPFWPQKILDDNSMVDFADAFDLIKYYKNKKNGIDVTKSDKLEEVVKNLKETSNPVIMILHP